MYKDVVNQMNSRNNFFIILSIIFFALFTGVVYITSGSLGESVDNSIANWTDQQSASLFTSIMDIASMIGSSEVVLLVTVLIGLYFIVKQNWHHFYFFFVLSVGGVILNLGLKMLIQRARPGDDAKFIEVFNYTFELQSYSFPSGHAMRASILFIFLVYLAIYTLKSKMLQVTLTVVYLGLLISVALSRVMLDAHFATDVIGAIVVSIAWFFLCLYIFYKPERASFSVYQKYNT